MTMKTVVLRAELRNWKIRRGTGGEIEEVSGNIWEDRLNIWNDNEFVRIQGMLTCSDYGPHFVIGEVGPGRSTYLLYKNSEKKD